MFPWHGAYCGDMDITGQRKPISHYRSMLYSDKEKLYLAVREPNPEPLKIKETWWSVFPSRESWTWPGFEGKPLQVDVYSKYPKVRLYLNDTLIAEKNTSKEQEFKATFSVPFSPGILKAVGIDTQQEMETMMLQTAGKPAKIRITADKDVLAANGQDLSFISIDITDDKGVAHPNANDRLTFKIEGAGSIIGVANGDLTDWDSYVGHTRKAWQGKALAVIKSNPDAGEIRLTVSAEGLKDAVLLLRSEREKQRE